MIAITKNIENIPASLIDKAREKAFLENKKAKKYVSNLAYKTKDVQSKLIEIYHNKCAYCEKNLDDTDKNIEHYRPKSIYYWLSFSWDNLLFCCAQCNRKKSNKFAIKGVKQEIDDFELLKFIDFQTISKELDEKEQPLLVNPERENQVFFDNTILFQLIGEKAGYVTSLNERVQYTIDSCDLNRKELVQKRLLILNDLKNIINRQKIMFDKKKDISELISFLSLLKQIEIEKINQNREFIALRKTIIANFVKLVKNIE